MWFVYIIECNDYSLYTGISNNVNKRLIAHGNNLGAKFTKGKGPFKLVYLEKYDSRSAATKREILIKKYSKKSKLKLVKTYMTTLKDNPDWFHNL
jgi:putative endonuclease